MLKQHAWQDFIWRITKSEFVVLHAHLSRSSGWSALVQVRQILVVAAFEGQEGNSGVAAFAPVWKC